ncbi:hypothetical protein Thivi_0777 [Thiocystis violascens DSM 198]|uniref:Uncharacterized protein n=1 Tax=Thiocystis violascens (strain ATCC 17096 / DSM 198 / 6111) TaxID=765911 RepID=I3Y760_THIV6|nr:hypothetical protein Thivi_0777 [Thiocystis violascens DSM 198]
MRQLVPPFLTHVDPGGDGGLEIAFREVERHALVPGGQNVLFPSSILVVWLRIAGVFAPFGRHWFCDCGHALCRAGAWIV